MWEQYYTPKSLDQALKFLAKHRGEARIVAGGTDLILELERGQRPEVKFLIDVTRIPKLDLIEIDEQGWIHLGPLVTHNQCAGSALIGEHAFTLVRSCWEVGAPQIRNRGTIAGNLATASPANDSIPPLMALGAQVTLQSSDGARMVSLEDFYQGVRKTVMHEDEMITDISFPKPTEQTHSMFVKLGLRRAQAISVVNAAVVLEMEEEQVQRAVVTLGSVAPTVIHAGEAERFLLHKNLTPEVIAETGELAMKAARSIDDLRGSAAYRNEMVRVCTVRALRAIGQNRERDGFPEHPVMLGGAKELHVGEELQEDFVHQKGVPIITTINGHNYRFETGQTKTLLRLLREEAGLTGTKEGCAEGECGACTVYLDGVAVMSCLVPAPRAHGAEIVTVEGLATDGKLHPVQQAFIDEGAVQCGYCTPGFLMSAAKLLEENPNPGRSEIAQAITGNLCRCTGYYKIISAIEQAAKSRV
jgi:xanthine dehydrogenase iron-sulfur cluster and FAD-binding subunit A